MLKFKKIELLTKTDKNPSVNQKKCCDILSAIRYMTCCAEKREIFFLGGH
jgi:hypothetical protein